MHPVGVRVEVGIEVLPVLKQAVVVGQPDEHGEVAGEVVEVDESPIFAANSSSVAPDTSRPSAMTRCFCASVRSVLGSYDWL